MPSGFRKYLIYVVAASLVLYSAIIMYFYSIQERALFYARTVPMEQPLGFAIQHQELFLNAPDGAVLNAVYFYAQNPEAVVLYFHGNAQNIMDMQRAAKPFVDRGYDFLAMDYRTYGKSTGELSEENLFNDATLFLDWLREFGWSDENIIYYGRSLGTGIAIELASRSKPRGILLYSPYYSMHTLVNDIYPFLPVDLILKYPLESGTYMTSVTSPVLIIHGDKDNLIPFHHAEQLAGVRGELVVIKGGGHNGLTRRPQFWESIDKFLDEIK